MTGTSDLDKQIQNSFNIIKSKIRQSLINLRLGVIPPLIFAPTDDKNLQIGSRSINDINEQPSSPDLTQKFILEKANVEFKLNDVDEFIDSSSKQYSHINPLYDNDTRLLSKLNQTSPNNRERVLIAKESRATDKNGVEGKTRRIENVPHSYPTDVDESCYNPPQKFLYDLDRTKIVDEIMRRKRGGRTVLNEETWKDADYVEERRRTLENYLKSKEVGLRKKRKEQNYAENLEQLTNLRIV
ncbi:uncharacterized protein LOC135929827 [Gordionus sp. m RMFG-2023]|uniref:uncharacterized protein LOC135929827 n=1 Tax=Gordionus sp. m RMFG-2023 TaxID=3053472 RepID=UPI0031FC1393